MHEHSSHRLQSSKRILVNPIFFAAGETSQLFNNADNAFKIQDFLYYEKVLKPSENICSSALELEYSNLFMLSDCDVVSVFHLVLELWRACPNSAFQAGVAVV
jgi:hypothetical protein